MQELQGLNIKAGHKPETSTVFIIPLQDFMKSISDPGFQVNVAGEKLSLMSYFQEQLSQHLEQKLDHGEALFMKQVISKLADFPVLASVDPKVGIKLEAAKTKADATPEPEEPKSRGPGGRL